MNFTDVTPSWRGIRRLTLALSLSLSLLPALAQNPAITVNIDAKAGKKPISPLIYGMAVLDVTQMLDLNCPLVRSGGNTTTRYNWKLNADNRGMDWYFESLGYPSAVAGERGDAFVAEAKSANALPMITIPLIEWVAKLGANRGKLASFSIKKYGGQTGNDSQWFPDAGNGILSSNGQFVPNNDPKDANTPSNSVMQQGWVKHLVSKWGKASKGGVRYYMMDNEPSIWFSTHRDVRKTGATMEEIRDKIIDYAGKVKAVDSSAIIVGPEEWGWSGYLLSGYDQQYGSLHGWGNLPDRAAHGDMDYLPWLLNELHKNELSTGKRLLDIFSVHYYPQGGEFSNDTSKAMQLKRNRSTRSLWDPSYTDESWIGSQVQLVPRLKSWVKTYYPGLKTAVNEYNWGAEPHINGATTQADVLGIFGREGLDMACRWTTPDPSTPTYKALKMYRNYDGFKSTFGDTSVQAQAPNPDRVSVFAATRASDGALTIMAISKYLSGKTPATLSLANFAHNGFAQVFQLTSANVIKHLNDVTFAGSSLAVSLPAQSITLFVIPKSGVGGVFTSSATASPASVNSGSVSTITAKIKCTQGALSNAIADIEVYDSNGVMVAQKFWTGQTFAAGNSKSFSFPWTSASTSGVYRVSVGVFGANWTPNYHWHTSAATITVTGGDTTQYNFENSTQGWIASGGMITGVSTSDKAVFAGAKSLAVSFGGNAGQTQSVSVGAPSTSAGKTITFHIWFPASSAIISLQPYVLQGAGGGWSWTGNWQSTSNLTPNAWNTITVTVPANAVTPLNQLGIEFTTNGAWTGTCYVDAVGW